MFIAFVIEGDAYHFIAFVPFQGKVYEIDGLKRGPINLGEAESSRWLDVARPAIEDRMARYSAAETHFALLSLNPKRSAQIKVRVRKRSFCYLVYPPFTCCLTTVKVTISTLEKRMEVLESVRASQSGFGTITEDGFAVGGSAAEVEGQLNSVCALPWVS